MQDLVLETVTREGRDDLSACLLGEFLKAITHDVEANSVIEQSHHRFLVWFHLVAIAPSRSPSFWSDTDCDGGKEHSL